MLIPSVHRLFHDLHEWPTDFRPEISSRELYSTLPTYLSDRNRGRRYALTMPLSAT